MHNELLGEIEIELCGEKHVIKPEFQGLVEMERRAGKPLASLVNLFIVNALGIQDLAAIIYGGLVGKLGSEPPIKFDELGNLIMRTGAAKMVRPCGVFITAAYTGEPVSEVGKKKGKKVPEKKVEGGAEPSP